MLNTNELESALKTDGDLPLERFRTIILSAGNDEPGWDQLFADEFQSRESNAGYQVGARLVRFLSKDLEKWKTLLVGGGAQYGYSSPNINAKLKDTPAAIPGSKPDTVFIFPNVPLSDWSEHFNDCCAFIGWSILTKLSDNYIKDMKDVKRKARWATTNRSAKTIGKIEEITVAKYVKKYMPDGRSDHQIRDFAAAIEESRKPLDLIFADTPEDMLTQYKTGPSSCMTYNGGNRDWGWLVKNHGIHLAAWYAYNPNTRGVYTTRKGIVSARAILWKCDKDKWKYGRIFAQNNTIHTRFVSALEEKGYTALSGYSYVHTEFKIPGIPRTSDKYNNEWVAPIPYFDNNGLKFNITFDKDNKEFFFVGDKSIKVGNLPGQGVISNLMCDAPVCQQCGGPVTSSRYMVANSTGKMYCGASCAHHDGYILAYMHDHDRRLILKSAAVHDAIQRDSYYLSSNIAVQLGGVQVLHIELPNDGGPIPIFLFPEEADDVGVREITCFGVSVLANNKHYRMQPADFEYAHARNMFTALPSKEKAPYLNEGAVQYMLKDKYCPQGLSISLIKIKTVKSFVIEVNE